MTVNGDLTAVGFSFSSDCAGRKTEADGGTERRGVGHGVVLLCRPVGRPVPAPLDQSGQPATRQRTLDQRG